MEKAQLPDLGGDNKNMLRHVEEARHTTPGSQLREVEGGAFPFLRSLSEYMLLGLFLALPQHRSQRPVGGGSSPSHGPDA